MLLRTLKYHLFTCRLSRKAATQQSVARQVDWLNGLIEPAVPRALWRRLPRFCQCWLRNLLFAQLVYFGVGLGWAYYIYQCFGSDLFPSQKVPAWRDMCEQMHVAFFALPLYALLPSITEELCERGLTLTYAHVSDVGVPRLCGYLVLYMAFVEFGVYWMHRGLHDVRVGYKCAPHAVAQQHGDSGLANDVHLAAIICALCAHAAACVLCQTATDRAVCLCMPMHVHVHIIVLFTSCCTRIAKRPCFPTIQP